jgi:DNA-binding response OmpR family regulator
MTQGDGGSPQILLLDDDADYCAQLSSYLEAYGFSVSTAQTRSGFNAQLAEAEPDLIILDQRLGETTATDVLRALRARHDTPCIVISGAADPFERVVNLELGADDEVGKSIAPRELLARIRALLRRARVLGHGRHAAPAEREPPGAGWQLSLERRELWRADGRTCPLTTAEFELLRILVERRGEPISRQELMLAVFRRPWKADDRAVDTVVRKLRRKISGDHGDGGIKTVRPTGYIFVGFPNSGPSDRLS